jgi:ATP-dependent DNA helicase RecG
MDYVQIAGKITGFQLLGEKRNKRLIATFRDASGEIQLIWFQGVQWIQKSLKENTTYLVFGRVSYFNSALQITHPEMEIISEIRDQKKLFEPVYSTTEKLKSRGLNSHQLSKLSDHLLQLIRDSDIVENIPSAVLKQYRLLPRATAFRYIHFPVSQDNWQQAQRRIKFEELFLSQVRIGRLKLKRHEQSKGWIFEKVGELFNDFFHHHLPFDLTNAQKRVLKEIRQDTATGRQMNRLLQGDVGSGKTVVALLSMLLAIDNGFQACLMAPTEILAQQHYQNIYELVKNLPVKIALLTGSIKGKARKEILALTNDNALQILIGTHALIEKEVQFANLGLAIVDEQHRFGVAQRAALWKKNTTPPHVLVMTATPIPRTLAMTVYGDLDVSVMDELPPGRQPVITVHRTEYNRPQVMDFIRSEIDRGRQAYIVYPLIEESEKLDYENLMKGYEEVKAFFPEPRYLVSMVHGKQPAEMRSVNMQRFVDGTTHIMVATTVIEVGVNVPNASVMVIESSEKFGLSQLHQLRGRVGRGTDKSYCILMTGNQLGVDAKKRIKTMTQTTNGFIIAEKDMEIRGPGDIEGTRQSGIMDFKLADIVQDKHILEAARNAAEQVLQQDPYLSSPDNASLASFLANEKSSSNWSKIS